MIPLSGSERTPLPGSKAIGPVDPTERLEVTIFLKSRAPDGALENMALEAGAALPADKPRLSREEFASAYGASSEAIASVRQFAKDNNLTVVEADPAKRSVVLSGTVADLGAAFGVELLRYGHPDGQYRGRTGSVQVPVGLATVIDGVLGLDNRPQAEPHFRYSSTAQAAAGTSFLPTEVARAYSFPTGLDGSGQCIALIELGGGYTTADLAAYFNRLGLPAPKVTPVSVDGGANSPSGDPRGPDGEVMLDIEIAAAIAPGAQIAVYFAPNSDRGFLDAVNSAIHDSQRNPSVVSISWGGPEPSWTAQAMQAFDQVLQGAAVLGVTVCAAAGDNGSSDGVTDGLQHVDFPASSPHMLACGGTRLRVQGAAISAETVWNDGPTGGATGGGVSTAFGLPVWQQAAGVPTSANPDKRVGRGVPDVAGDADPVTGYQVEVDGQQAVIGGTSGVAPLWAGLIALMNQKLGKPVGYLNPLIYGSLASAAVFHDVVAGNNGSYQARRGWDACTGFGSPIGSKLLDALSATGQHHAI